MIWEREKEEEDLMVAVHERATRAVMAAVHGAAGHRAGIRAAAEWEMFPRAKAKTREIPTVQQVTTLFPVDQPLFDWAEVEALSAGRRQ